MEEYKMQSLTNVVNVLTASFNYYQGKRGQDELMGYMNTYLSLPQCQHFVMNQVHNIKSGNTAELGKIYEELMENRKFDLAQKVKPFISGEATISEELYTALELYFKSESFHKHVEENVIHYANVM